MNKFNEKSIIERIKLLREQYYGSRGRSNFAHSLGISPSTYNYYENNRIPPIDILLKICEITGCDLEWLLTGKQGADQSKKGVVADLSMSPLLQRIDSLLSKYPDLSEPLSAFIELLSEKKGLVKTAAEPKRSAKSSKVDWIPVLGRTAAGMVHFWDQTYLPEPAQAVTELQELVRRHTGKEIISSADGAIKVDFQAKTILETLKGCAANIIQLAGEGDEQIVEFVQCEKIFKLFPDSFALHIDGDSMAPGINDGDIVVLSPSVPAAQGCAAVAKVAGQIGVTCKLIRTSADKVHLIAINEKYETKVLGVEELLWALAVLCHIRI